MRRVGTSRRRMDPIGGFGGLMQTAPPVSGILESDGRARPPAATDSRLVSGDGGWSVPPAGGPRPAASVGLQHGVLHEIESGDMGARLNPRGVQSNDTASDRITKIHAWLAQHADERADEPTTPTQP